MPHCFTTFTVQRTNLPPVIDTGKLKPLCISLSIKLHHLLHSLAQDQPFALELASPFPVELERIK